MKKRGKFSKTNLGGFFRGSYTGGHVWGNAGK